MGKNSKIDWEARKSTEKDWYKELEEARRISRYRNTDSSMVDQAYINSFLKDAENYFNTASTDYGNLTWGTADSSYNNRNKQWADLSSRADAVGAYFYNNRNRMGADAYEQYQKYFDTFYNEGRNVVGKYEELADYYSNWETQEAYDLWKAERDARNELRQSSDYNSFVSMGKNDEWRAWDLGSMVYPTAMPNDIGNYISQDLKKMSDYLGDEEVSLLYYYLGKNDFGNAEKLYAEYMDAVNRAEAGNMVSKYDNSILEPLISLGAGVDSFFSGYVNAGYGLINSALEFAGNDYRFDTTNYGSKNQYAFGEMSVNNEGLWAVTNDLSQVLGNQLPSFIANVATGGALGSLPMGISAAGNAYSDFKSLGYSEAQSVAYGVTIGALEATLQKAFGGISGLGSDGGFASNAVKKILPQITNGLARASIQLGASMFDEGLEELTQSVLEPIVKQVIALGKTPEGQDMLLEIDWGEAVYSGLLGALSAGALEGGTNAINTIQLNKQYSNAYSKNPEALKTLLESIAMENPGLDISKIQSKVDAGKNVSGNQIRNLLYQNELSNWNKDYNKVVDATETRLNELGEQGNVRALAESIARGQFGDFSSAIENAENVVRATKDANADTLAYAMADYRGDVKDLSRSDKRNIRESEYGRRVSNELNPDMREETSSAWAERIKTNRLGKGAEGVAKTQATLKMLKDSTKAATVAPNTFNYKSGAITPTLTKEGVQAKEKDLEGIANNRGYKGTTNEAFVKGYKGENLEEYQLGFDEAYRMGRTMVRKEELQNAVFKSYINEEAQMSAYSSGYTEAKYESIKKAEGRVKTEKTKGGFTVTVSLSNEALTESRKTAIEFLKVVADIANANIKVVEDAKNHGLYDPKTNTIYIDINFGGKDFMVYSLSHELTHRIREALPEQFDDFAKMLFEAVGEKMSITERIKLWEKNNKQYYPKLTPAQLNDLAYEEVVCEMCESFLTDKVVARKFSEKVQKENKTLWEKIKDFFTDLINRLKEAYEGLDPQSENGRLVREMTDDLTKVKEAWAELVIESGKVERKVIEQDLANKDVSHSRKYYEEHLSDLDKKYDSDEAMVSLETLKKRYEKVVEIWDRLGGELNSQFLEEWNNKSGKDRSFTVFKAQAGYKYNIELSSMCKKGVPLFEAIDTIVKKEVMKELNVKVIGKAEKQILYDLLQKHNFDIPCQICYVEQARQREGGIIDAFLNGKVETNKKGETTKFKLGWNQILDMVEKEMKNLGVTYKFASVDRSIGSDSYTPAEVVMDEKTQKAYYEALKKVANDEITRYNKDERKARQLIKDTTPSAINATLGGTLPSNLKIIKTLFMESNSRLKIESDLLYSSMTTKNLATFHHELYTAFNMQGGVSGYKTKQGTVVYWGDILKKTWEQDTIRKAGGIRNQSNSDFQMYTFLDQVQMYIDFSAKGYYLQAYTKVLAELKLFGKSGAKINASLIPRVKVYQNADGSVDIERTRANAGLDENGNLIFDDIEGINHKEAFMLIADPEYSKNIGGICIGYSDNHIAKMLDDDRIQLIIGYHDKTDDPNARYRGARYAKNYNGLNEAQNGTKTVHIGFNKFVGQAEKKFGYDVATETFAKESITYKGETYVVDDIPRLAANLYLEECQRKGYAPAYSKCDIDFSKHPNYYKLLADFSLYNSEGHYCPHKKVQFNMPSTVPYLDANGVKSTMSSEAYIKKELEAEMKVRDSISEALADESADGLIPSFVREVNALHDETELKHSIKYTSNNEPVVWIDDDVLKGSTKPTHQAVADYLAQHIGEVYTIIESGQNVYLGEDLPSEYTQSEYTKQLLKIPRILKAKNKALPNLGEMIEIATNRRWSKDKGSGNKDAKYGVYKYSTRFAFPTRNNKGNIVGANAYDATLVIINSSDGKKYLYDVVTIKKNTSVSVELSNRVSIPAQRQVQMDGVSDNNITQEDQVVNTNSENSSEEPKKSRKIPDPYTSRELLAKALTKVAKGDEKVLLEQYKSNLRMIEGEMGNLKNLRKEIDAIKYKKSITYKGENLSVKEFEQRAYTQAETMGVNAENVKFKAHKDTGKYVATVDGKVILEADKAFRSKEEADHINTLEHNYQATLVRISKYDASLLRIEAMQPMKQLLTREKAKAYKEAEAKGKEALKEYKAQAIEQQKEISQRYQEMRHKNVEQRATTEMRHKLMNTVHTLDQLLVNPTKKKHIPIGLQKPVAEALNILNMDTVGAEERLAKITAELKVTDDPYEMEMLLERYNRIKAQGDKIKEKIDSLKSAYAEILNSDDDIIRNSYDEVIANTIEQVASKVGDTPVRDMTYDQLESLYKMYRMILKTIRDANKSFTMAKGEEISTLGQNVMSEVAYYERKDKAVLPALEKGLQLTWNNLKPVYAFERIGSSTLAELYNNVRHGEDVWAVDMQDARAYSDAQKVKYGYKSWDMEKTYTFHTPLGKEFKLNLGQIMSIYAYTRRGEQAIEHLINGGFVYDGVTIVKKKIGDKIKVDAELKDSTAYRLDEAVIGQINATLTKEQREFAEAMQKYLSETMGEKGNEVSLALYDIKIFGEKNYFPLKSSQVFLERAREQARGEVKIKNKGFTKETTPRANNPITLTSFMDVWADHCIEMSMYHAFTLPMEDFYRVYNYKERATDEKDTESVIMNLENAYGKSVTSYIDQLLVDLNGGLRTDPRAGALGGMVAGFKKASTMASLSVVVQQPSSIIRAMSMVDAKYFIDKPSKYSHKETWEEVKKYAPVAVIKEMGYFDVGLGKTSQEWLKNDPTKYEQFEEKWLTRAPALADEMGWNILWKAIKREMVAKHPELKINSEEFLNECGRRFTEVVSMTQVYDSVFSRSANMRSKDTGMKMLTSFMAESTTISNMFEDAMLKARRGNKKVLGKTISAIVFSSLVNAIAVSFVYAARDDEDEEYWNKYFKKFVDNFGSNLNPIAWIPIGRDIMSLIEGYDVERADMSLISDFISAVRRLSSTRVEAEEKVSDLIGAIANLFGVPLKNLYRDAKAIWNLFTK